ncbi:hypothetical protein Q0Z83_038040 [Actinoplanes sichuanensis]|uniref:Uncharacterized protein n=1 Tax=Actinoplanes sichuanensis TaxID=512349 RepID=A0ABW4A4N8_9ACTN|nr:hypothetical protein [Actinoplanes sichuanensis]BEL05613.1 hypothetical protein Q0Z83_038040 [Actinoplanes sichuanensis]
MTGARDIEPPPPETLARPPDELQIGHDLEDVYCAYTEADVIITRGFPDFVLERMHDMCGWTADRIRELGVDPTVVDRFEEIVAELPGHPEFARFGPDWAQSRVQISAEMENMQHLVRTAIDSHRVRYYDYGVMICRIRLCVRMIRLIPALPENLADQFSHLQQTYHAELSRATAVLQTMVAQESPTRQRDPGQIHLDRAFEAFTDYLAIWRTGEALVTDDLTGHLRELTTAIGFRGSDRSKQELVWLRHPKPLAEEDRLPLPVPHSSDDRERLAFLLDQTKQLVADGDVEGFLERMRHLLHMYRAVLGPIHPLTLHVHVDFAAGYVAVGRSGTATLMLHDIVNTALYYYGPYHPARYLIAAHAHSYLTLTDPESAGELYDFPLKSLVERAETDLPSGLHQARRTIRESLGMDAS